MPERREDAVERVVGERKLLGVRLDPFDLDPGRRGLPPPAFEQLGNEIEPGHLGAGARCGKRGVAGAASDVEHVHAARDGGAVDDVLADILDVLRQRSVVARRPDRALPLDELVHLASLGRRAT